jgi:hypothetical protein
MRSLRFSHLPFAARFALAGFAIVALNIVPASASILWHWNYSGSETGSEISASGTFATLGSPNGDGGYLITSITGTRNGKTITGLQAPGTSIPGNEPFTVDNLVFLGFSISDATFSNPFYADLLPTPAYLEFFSTPPFTGGHTELPVQFSAAPVPVPEPATSGLVLGALALARYWSTRPYLRRRSLATGRQ